VHRIANASHALVPEQPAAIAEAIAAWAAQRFSAP
jgi:pimeloyl-ACP methyl ester carboxylesterase